MALAVSQYTYIPQDLAWSEQPEQQSRFNRLLRWLLALVIFLAFLFAFLPLPEPEEIKKPEPERLVKLIPKVVVPPPPPPEVAPAETKVKPQPKPEVKPKPQQQKEPIKTAQEPKKAPVPSKTAREVAASSGLLAMKDDLSDIKKSASLAALSEKLLSRSGATGQTVQRSLVTKNYGKSSEGINTANLSTNTGGSGLGGRSASSVGGSGAGGGTGGGFGGGAGGDGSGSGSGYGATRDQEKIQIVFDQNKSSLFILYNRELRRDASLQGKLLLNITIAPSGKVTSARIVSSQLGSASLENKIIQRIKLINFGAEDVPSYNFNYPIDFYPT